MPKLVSCLTVITLALATATACPAQTPSRAAPTGAAARLASGAMVLEAEVVGEVLVGEEFTFRWVVTNTMNEPMQGATVLAQMTPGLTLLEATPEPQHNANLMTWGLGDLQPGERRELTVRAKANATGEFKPCAMISWRHRQACTTIRAVQPRLTIEKTGPAEALVCEPITFDVVVTNTGDGRATNVVITDELPDGLVAQVGGRESSKVIGRVGTLEPGKSAKITVTARATRAGVMDNQATVTADGGARAEATHRVTVRKPVLEVTKQGPAMRYTGRNATFDITVRNTGDGEARNLALTDDLPTGLSFVSASDGGKAAGRHVTWQLGTLAPGGSRKVSLTVRCDAKQTLRNEATATALCATASGSAEIRVEGIPAILLEVVDLDDPIELGSNETYLIEVTNQGSADGTNIRVVCTLPPEQQFVRAEGPTTATADGQTVTLAPLGSLPPRHKATWRVTVRGTGTGDVRFRAELTSDQMTSPARESESTHIYE